MPRSWPPSRRARRDAEAAATAVWAGLDQDLAVIARGGERTACDSVLAAGERLAVPIFVAGLRARGLRAVGVDGASVIRTDEGWGGVAPKTIPPLALSRIPVFVGNTSRRSGEGTWVGRDRSWVENDSSSVETDRSWAAAKAVASTAINGHARIGVLPSSRASAPHLRERVLQVLADVHIAATPGPEAEGAAVTVVVDTEDRARAVRALHAALVRPGAALGGGTGPNHS